MRTRKTRTWALLACVGALALSVVGAGTAWAGVPATFTGSGQAGVTATTPLVIKAKAPHATYTYTCAPAQIQSLGASFVSSTAVTPGFGIGGSLSVSMGATCSAEPNGAPTWVNLYGFGTPLAAEKTGSVFSLRGTDSAPMTVATGCCWWQSNNGRAQPDYNVAWTNGTSAANPSRATFNDTQIGITSAGVPITLTGTMSFTRGGGLVTMQ